ncbi:tetratricopeptide repeat protein, partial [Planctomycetota bacterium]|nr:tetratricopeptide repeat protein [Planctomycetota bacterium]
MRVAMEADPRFSPTAEVVLERLELLGEGGMGSVYRVRDQRLGREAALKLVKAEASKPHLVARFQREVELTARVEHPAVPPVFDAGTSAAGQHYLLMRVVEGDTLEARIRARTDRRELLGVLARVAEATTYAHSQGVVHRDLKPANVMIGAFGEVLVMDWGLAKDLNANDDAETMLAEGQPQLSNEDAREVGLTQAGAVMGTPGYMAPEQASGEPLDGRADVFALGAILSEILTGKVPVDGVTPLNRIYATIKGQIVLPGARHSNVPPELDSVAARALAVDPEDRYPGALEFTRDLQAWLAGEAVGAHAYTSGERIRRAAARRATRLVSGALVALIVMLSAGLGMWLVSARIERQLAESKLAASQASQRRIQDALDLLDQARGDGVKGIHEETRKKINRALAIGAEEGDASPRFLLWNAAQAYEEAGLLADAREVLVLAVEGYPPAYRELFRLHVLEIAGRTDDRFAWTPWLSRIVEEAERRGDENEFTWFAHGDKAADRAEAARSYSRAIDHNGRFAWAYGNRGLCRLSVGDLTGALADFDRAVEIDPRNSDSWLNRGVARMRASDWPGALADLDRAITLEPDDPLPYQNRSLARKLVDDLGGALADATRAVELDSSDPHSYVSRAKVRLALGELRDALLDAERALELSPDFALAFVCRGEIRAAQGNHAGAIADASRAVELASDDATRATAYTNRGTYRRERGDSEGAIADCEQALQIGPPYLKRTYSVRGQAHLDLGNHREALEDFDRVVGLDSRNALANYNRGCAHSASGDFERALADYTRAIKLDPNLAMAFLAR